jgi:hypothetical protein
LNTLFLIIRKDNLILSSWFVFVFPVHITFESVGRFSNKTARTSCSWRLTHPFLIYCHQEHLKWERQ